MENRKQVSSLSLHSGVSWFLIWDEGRGVSRGWAGGET